MAEGASSCELPVNSAPHTRSIGKIDINAPGKKFPVSRKQKEHHCPRMRGLASQGFHAHFPAHDCAEGRLMAAEQPATAGLSRQIFSMEYVPHCAFALRGMVSEKMQWQRYFQSARTLAPRGFASAWCRSRHSC
ncbi:MAG: hypothetical protein WC861_03355 [Candidatus Micrarchaeia archaeon]|jgi:hypothetical protein